MTAVEVKGRGLNIALEIVDIYRASNEGMRLLEKLADRTGYMGRTTLRSVALLEVISTYLMRTGMTTRKNLGALDIFK
jgi:hypothetical protein